MKLSVTLQKEIVDFLISLPDIDNNEKQRALIVSAGLDTALQSQIRFGVSAILFFQLLVPILIDFGILEDGRNALEAVLESAKNYVGKKKKTDCDKLIQKIRDKRSKRTKLANRLIIFLIGIVSISIIAIGKNRFQVIYQHIFHGAFPESTPTFTPLPPTPIQPSPPTEPTPTIASIATPYFPPMSNFQGVTVLMVDSKKQIDWNISHDIANLLKEEGITVKVLPLFTDSFVKNGNFYKIFNGDAKEVKRLGITQQVTYLILGEKTTICRDDFFSPDRVTADVSIMFRIIALQDGVIQDSFPLSRRMPDVSCPDAERQAVKWLLEKFQLRVFQTLPKGGDS